MLEHHKKFHFVDGKVVGNLKELVAVLGQIDDRQFHHHANDERNDFSNWIANVLDEEGLADEIRHTSRITMIKKIKNYIKPRAFSEPKKPRIVKMPKKSKSSINAKSKLTSSAKNAEPRLKMHPRPFTEPEKQNHMIDVLAEVEKREQQLAEMEHGLQRMISTSKAMKSEDFIYGLIFGVVIVFFGYLIYSVL